MKAERDRRAMILEAEGDKTAAIERAQGTKQSAILEAEGRATAIKEIASAERAQKILIAEGEAQAIQNVFSAIHEGGPTDDLLAYRYIDALKYVADGKATKIFMPLEMQGIGTVVGSIGELFKSTQEGAAE
jgi:regulator of protease activity HflC (stomatin/prohibitin superfamily)